MIFSFYADRPKKQPRLKFCLVNIVKGESRDESASGLVMAEPPYMRPKDFMQKNRGRPRLSLLKLFY